MKKYKLVKIFFLILLCIIPSMVSADEFDEKKDTVSCIDGSMYTITEKGSMVRDIHSLTSDNLKNKSVLPKEYFEMKTYLANHNIQIGTPAVGDLLSSVEFQRRYGQVYQQYKSVLEGGISEENKYRFEASSLSRKCNLKRGPDGSIRWTSCPVTSQYNTHNALYTTTRFQEAMIKGFTFDSSKGSFYVEMKDIFNSTLIVRAVRNGNNNVENYDLASLQALGRIGAGELNELNASGLKLYFAGGAKVRLEFYLKDSVNPCGGAYVGSVDSTAPSYAEVANPWLNSPICKSLKEGYSHIQTSPIDYKSILVPECYKATVDYFSELPNISEASIQAKINNASSIFNGSQNKDINQQQCFYHTDGHRDTDYAQKTFIYNPSSSGGSGGILTGDYWAASCTEKVTVDYDQPKIVNPAGTGFSYDAKLIVTRTCTPFKLKEVQKPTKCLYNIECWGGPANHTGEGGAGPNEEFDSCVNTCDGGKYSKDCINKCYEKVYEGKDVQIISSMSNIPSFMDVVKAKQMATDTCSKKTPTSPNYCYTSKGWPTTGQTDKGKTKTDLGNIIYELASKSNNDSNCNGTTACTSFHGHTFTYLNTCNSTSNPTRCYEVYSSAPRPICSDNPEEDYRKQKEDADAEYAALLTAIRNYENDEKAEMTITDTYKKNGGQLATTTVDSQGIAKIESTVYPYKETVGANGLPNVTVEKSYQIHWAKAVIDMIDGKEKYVDGNYKLGENERDAGNKYYTDYRSPRYNDYRTWVEGYSPRNERGDNVGNNINVIFRNIGTSQGNGQYTWNSIDIDCFYGVIPSWTACENGICPDLYCSENDVCTHGIQFMFRQVDLTNMFPDRDPRWNWRYKSTFDSDYSADPSETISEIQSLGNGAFSEEHVDYEITITKNDIRRIRSYNKRADNYQNFPDMSCFVQNGKKVCESEFLGNYTKFQRNTTLGTND